MAHVGIERLAAGQRQEHRADHRKRDDGIGDQETRGLGRIDRLQNGRRHHDVASAQQPDDDEPDHHDRTEQRPDALGPPPLDHEQSDQDDQRDRHDEFFEPGRDQLQPFHGRKHRDRRGDDAIAAKQGGADHAEHDEHGKPRSPGNLIGSDQREQCQDTAFAVIVGAQDENDVF